MKRPSTYHITTLGCLKNQADSRAMAVSLETAGLRAVELPSEADFHLINSCAFIEAAREETIQVVLESAQIKRGFPEQKLVLVGCFAERYLNQLESELPEVDLLIGTGQYHQVGEKIKSKFKIEPELPHEVVIPAEDHYAAVKIADGCSRSCTFCAIPSFRGSFRTRPIPEIVKECRALAAEGVREVMLVSQDSNSFGAGAMELVELVAELNLIEELEWIRLLYLYPDRKTERLLEKLSAAKLERLVPYLESPIQHVSAPILKAMQRGGSYESYLELFYRARELFVDLEIRTAFLVGFPGETAADVDRLHQFIEEARPEKLALFGYSPEEGTGAAGLTSELTGDEINLRINRLRESHLAVLKEINVQRMGRTYRCMVDEVSERGVIGHRAQDAPGIDGAVFIDGGSNLAEGAIIDVKLNGFLEYDIYAEVIE